MNESRRNIECLDRQRSLPEEILIDKPHLDFLEEIYLNKPTSDSQFLDQQDNPTFKMSMITAAQWVPRGFAAPFPQKYTLDEAEFERIAGLAKLQLDDAEEDLKEAEEDAAGESGKKEDDEEMKVDGAKEKKSKYAFLRWVFVCTS